MTERRRRRAKALGGSLAVLGLLSTSIVANELREISLEELLQLDIGVASNVVADQRKQPVSVSTINANQINLSGARTLNELLTIYVPGYFLVEDQDDTIAGFRGLVPDNNSKVMLLINGQNINTEWFWGPPDAILNSIDLGYIERIEVVRGPGSVVQGQGALLGVVNIVTRQGAEYDQGVQANLKQGEDGLSTKTLSLNFADDDTRAFFYLSQGQYGGQLLPERGWANRTDQGLTVFERQHRLRSSDYQNALANIQHKGFQLNVFHFEQARDNYNFFRDREVIVQSLDGINGSYQYEIDQATSLQLSLHYERDDYALRSHGGNIAKPERLAFETEGSAFSDIINAVPGLADSFVERGLTMGGTREIRRGAKLLFKMDELLPNHRLAIGAEYNHYKSGLPNAAGNNFIINEEIQRLGITADADGNPIALGSVNDLNRWVNPDRSHVRSLFAEDFYSINDQFDVFAAFRWDDHPNWGSQVSPRLGALYDIDGRHLFRFTWQTGFRGAVGVQFAGGFLQDGLLSEASFAAVNALDDDIVDDFDGDGTNDAPITLNPVKPETIENWELAYTYSGISTTFHGIVFYNIVEDILTAQAHSYDGFGWGDTIGLDPIGTWGGHFYYQNQQGKLQQVGSELELQHHFPGLTAGLSHAFVQVLDADPGTLGIYVLPGEKNAAYPEHISRIHLTVPWYPAQADVMLRYNHLYYWDFDAPTGNNLDGAQLGNLGVSVAPTAFDGRLTTALILKNVWDADELYPINATGNITGTDGAPTNEARTWWLELNYQF